MNLKRKLYLKCDIKSIYAKFTRTKPLSTGVNTRLKRCLNLYHICFLGVGHMIGAGIHTFTGEIIRTVTGPAIILSYMLAGIAALLSALCYAELEAKIPKAGSAYSYTYVAIGEFCAFIIGWDIILENTIGAATLAKAWSAYFDVLLDHRILNATKLYIGGFNDPHITGNTQGPDFLAALLVISVSLMICLGARRSANFNSCFAVLSIAVIVFVISYGLVFADFTNWTDPKHCKSYCIDVPSNITVNECRSVDAFFPYGFTSVWQGAAHIFFAFIGFEAIASAGEEAKYPRRSLPFGTLLAMAIVTVGYVLMSATLSLMLPYCRVEDYAAKTFLSLKKHWAYILVSVGALSAMTTVLFGHLFALPRGVYAMSMDGLFFAVFKRLHSRTQVPILASVVFGLLATLLALFFNLKTLAQLVSIGNLTAYNAVALCVIILRYSPKRLKSSTSNRRASNTNTNRCMNNSGQLKDKFIFLKPLFSCFKPDSTISWTVLFMIPLAFGIGAMINFAPWSQSHLWWCILLTVLLAFFFLFCVLVVFGHNQREASHYFQVPLVPFIPAASLVLNTILMIQLTEISWIRFIIWFAIGTVIYFVYSIRYSNENKNHQTTPGNICTNGSIFGTNNEMYYMPNSETANNVFSLNVSAPNYIMTRIS